MDESQKEILEQITERLREELLGSNLKLLIIMVENIAQIEQTTLENVKEFMESSIEVTANQTDVIGTSELYDTYYKWNSEKQRKLYPEMVPQRSAMINYIENASVLGKHLVNLNYKTKAGRFEGKQVRGFGYIKYKGEADNSTSVKEFMEKYTERTESLKDKVSISKMLPKFYREHKERYGEEIFIKKLHRNGYKTKAAKETQRVEGRYGKEKVIKVGMPVNCVLKVRLKNEFYKEEWTQVN
jgi:hypothetical protein